MIKPGVDLTRLKKSGFYLTKEYVSLLIELYMRTVVPFRVLEFNLPRICCDIPGGGQILRTLREVLPAAGFQIVRSIINHMVSL